MSETFRELFKQGIAYCYSDIKTDSFNFEFEDEFYSFPTIEGIGIAVYNGYFYTAKIKDVRALAEKNKNGQAKKQKEKTARA